jgi:endonuclease/exonuclease/phosphatase family metal-dependent hydrolase
MRIVQFNVRRFTLSNGECSVDAATAALQRLAPCVVCFNEVDIGKKPGVLEKIAAALGGQTPFHTAFFPHVKGKEGWGGYGNAILSRFPLLSRQEVPLRGGTEIQWPTGSDTTYRIHRGLLVATVDVGGGRRVNIASTHLDHMQEQERVTQMQHALEVLSSPPRSHLSSDGDEEEPPLPSILVG